VRSAPRAEPFWVGLAAIKAQKASPGSGSFMSSGCSCICRRAESSGIDAPVASGQACNPPPTVVAAAPVANCISPLSIRIIPHLLLPATLLIRSRNYGIFTRPPDGSEKLT
jgi:hypothetical protein